MSDVISISIAALALFVSSTTAWFTLLRRGRLCMTQPTIVAFVFDGPSGPPKVVIRTLLFSTGHRGVIVENMYVIRSHDPVDDIFTVWGYSEGNVQSMVRGSGLYVGVEGSALYHHFVLPENTNPPIFRAGTWSIEVHAKTLGNSYTQRLAELQILVNEDIAAMLARRKIGVLFNLDPRTGKYVAETRG